MGSHATGATAVPANLHAANSDTAPPRLAGTASTEIVFSAAHKSADAAPPANHRSAIASALGATPSGVTATAHMTAPIPAARAGPRRSDPSPPQRPNASPAAP